MSVCSEAVSAVLCIDHSRVYVTGESNGGMLAHYLVQSLPGGRCGYGMGMSPGSTEVSQKCAFAQHARSPGLVFYHVLYIHAYTHTHIYIHKIILYMLYIYVIYIHVFVAYVGVSQNGDSQMATPQAPSRLWLRGLACRCWAMAWAPSSSW